MADPLFFETAAAFRHARLQLGWSQELFAEKALVAVGTIRTTEAGNRISARTHKALVDAINKARAACHPPMGPLTIEFSVAPAPTIPGSPEQAESEPSAATPAKPASDPSPYPEAQSAELLVNDVSAAMDAPIPAPGPVKGNEPPRFLWADDHCLMGGGIDAWRIKDACEGVVIFGATGSGKTSGSGQTLACAYLRAGFGGGAGSGRAVLPVPTAMPGRAKRTYNILS